MLTMSPNIMSITHRATQFSELMAASKATHFNHETLEIETAVTRLCSMLADLRQQDGTLYLLGNGGSASVSSHAATDFFNVAKLRAITLHESSMLTCMTNDYGYENAYARMVCQMVKPKDIVIAISSSGQSKNIRNAVKQAREKGAIVITLSGFDVNNPLRLMGELNFWLDSSDFGMVEIGHQFILHNISDRLRDELGA